MEPHPIGDYIELEFAGQTWRLTLSVEAEVEFELSHPEKRTIGQFLERIFSEGGKSGVGGVSVFDLTFLIWHMARRYHPDETHKSLISRMKVTDIPRLLKQVTDAVRAFQPQSEGGASSGADDPFDERMAAPTGMPSGHSAGRFSVSRRRKSGV